MFITEKHKNIAEQFCSWADCYFKQIKMKTNDSPIRTLEYPGGGFDIFYQFAGTTLNTEQLYFNKSLVGLVKNEEPEKLENQKENQFFITPLIAKYLFVGGIVLICLTLFLQKS